MPETLREIGLKTPTGYYPWYPRDFGSSGMVLQMTFTAQGIYRALLDRQWEDGGIPEDPERCRRILRCSEEEWDHFAPFFEDVFPLQRGNMRVNARMESIRLAAEKRIVDAKTYGKRGAEKRWGARNEPENRVPYGDPIANINRNIDINENTNKTTEEEVCGSDEPTKVGTAFVEPMKEKDIGSLERGGPCASFQKPSVKDIEMQMNALRFASRQAENESARFFDHYESVGWRIGKNPMRNWQSAVANWKRNMIDKGTFIEVMPSPSSVPLVSEFYTDEFGKLRSLVTNRIVDE